MPTFTFVSDACDDAGQNLDGKTKRLLNCGPSHQPNL
nr:MAG TPA: hypothetical protein [Caudoviricetes sp.]